MEKRHNYVRKTSELATQLFINPATNEPNVAGLILAGLADLKTKLSQSDMFHPRLQAKILDVVNVSEGGEKGFNKAIELSSDIVSNGKFIEEKRLMREYFDEMRRDVSKCVFGVDDTMKALEMGVVKILIVWENLDTKRYALRNCANGQVFIRHLNKEQQQEIISNNQNNYFPVESEVSEEISLLEWFSNEYKRFGCTLEFVTNKSEEGSRFCQGFGGIGGILRYPFDMRTLDENEGEDNREVDDDDDDSMQEGEVLTRPTAPVQGIALSAAVPTVAAQKISEA